MKPLIVAMMLTVGQPNVKAPEEAFLNVGHATAMAHADLARMAPEQRLTARYLWQGNRPAKERLESARVLAGHCNGLSRESDIVRPSVIGGGMLLRIDLADYGWSRDLWDRLSDSDPYFHVTTETWVPWRGGVWQWDGKFYPPGSFRVRGKTERALIVVDPAHEAIVAQVVAWTQSKSPILRSDWFFNQTAAQQDRPVGYYDMLGVKDERDFQALIGFDSKRKRRRVEAREAVSKSGVTLQPRGIVREASDDGGYWKTFDFRKAADSVNPLRVLGRDIEENWKAAGANDAATEQYGLLANGMWATFLGNNKGERQAAAPDFIASDSHSRSTDRRVHVNVSCIRCHTNGGLQDVNGWAGANLRGPNALVGPDLAALRLLRQQYARELKPLLDRDRATYSEAVKQATGWTTQGYAAAYASEWERYEDADVGIAWAARDLGVSQKALIDILNNQKRAGTLDVVLAGVLRGETIGIRQWEETYPLAFLAMKAGGK